MLSVSCVDDSGMYSAELCFSFGEETSMFTLSDIAVNIYPRELYLEHDGSEFVIVSGSVIDGDDPKITEVEKAGEVYAISSDNNYCLKFSPVKIKNDNLEIKAAVTIAVVLLLLALAAFAVFKSDENDKIIQSISTRVSGQREDDPFIARFSSVEKIEKDFLSFDRERADELITNRMAKNMIFPGGSVFTAGSLQSDVPLEVLENSFSDGERVDINKLKDRGIVSCEVFKIKIISDGLLSKPLEVYANEFDPSAVKIIALTGGRAFRVKSKKIRQ
jgi:ribosomal protein L18E